MAHFCLQMVKKTEAGEWDFPKGKNKGLDWVGPSPFFLPSSPLLCILKEMGFWKFCFPHAPLRAGSVSISFPHSFLLGATATTLRRNERKNIFRRRNTQNLFLHLDSLPFSRSSFFVQGPTWKRTVRTVQMGVLWFFACRCRFDIADSRANVVPPPSPLTNFLTPVDGKTKLPRRFLLILEF